MTTPTPLPIPGALTPGNGGFIAGTSWWPSTGPFAYGSSYFVFAFSQYNGAPGPGGGFQDGLPSTLSAWRTDDGGATWALVDNANAKSLLSLTDPAPVPGGFTVEARVFWSVLHPTDSSLVWIIYLDVAGAVRVSEFNMATSTWGATSAAGPIPPLDLGLPQPQFAVLASVFGGVGGDTLYVRGWETQLNGNGQPTLASATYTLAGGIGGAWNNLGPWPGLPPLGMDGQYTLGPLVAGTGGRVHGFFSWVDSVIPGVEQGYHYLLSDGAGGSGAAPNALPPNIYPYEYTWAGALVGNTVALPMNEISGLGSGGGILHAPDGDNPLWVYDEWPLAYAAFLANFPLAFSDVEDGSLTPILRLFFSGGIIGVGGELSEATWTPTGSFSPPANSNLFYPEYYPYLDGRQTGSFGLTGGTAGGAPMVAFLVAAPSTILATPEAVFKEPVFKSANYYDCCLDRFREFVEANLTKLQPNTQSCEMVEMPGGYMMPAEGREWYERASIITPAINPAPGQLVLDFLCPVGYRGLLYGVTNLYLGTGFVQGSGDLIWRLQIGNAWVKDMGNMLYMLGSVGQPFPFADQYYVEPQQRVRMYVQTVNASGAIQVGVARMVMELQGWWMPV